MKNRKKLRLEAYDYDWNGTYFVTFCIKNRIEHFGEISNNTMKLSEIGKIAHDCWVDIPNHFDDVELDAFVIMPNHVHGVLNLLPDEKYVNAPSVGDADLHHLQMRSRDVNIKNDDPTKKRLPKIMQQYKSSVTRIVRGELWNYEFAWPAYRTGRQRSYYDVIVRDDIALQNIRNYIEMNPFNWRNDKMNPHEGQNI